MTSVYIVHNLRSNHVVALNDIEDIKRYAEIEGIESDGRCTKSCIRMSVNDSELGALIDYCKSAGYAVRMYENEWELLT